MKQFVEVSGKVGGGEDKTARFLAVWLRLPNVLCCGCVYVAAWTKERDPIMLVRILELCGGAAFAKGFVRSVRQILASTIWGPR